MTSSNGAKKTKLLEFNCEFSCNTKALNGTDVKGSILLCINNQDALDPFTTFKKASQHVQDGGGSGLIFAHYTTDIIDATAYFCPGIACVVVDLDVGNKICQYFIDSRYFLCFKIPRILGFTWQVFDQKLLYEDILYGHIISVITFVFNVLICYNHFLSQNFILVIVDRPNKI